MLNLSKTPIEGLLVVHNGYKDDTRGRFCELYKQSKYQESLIGDKFVQDNMSCSDKGVLRGLHFQTWPFEQDKLVYCLSGCIFDVAVDLRPGSKTFKHNFATNLIPNGSGLYIPKGFAHGFYAEEPSIIFYKCSNEYKPEYESGVRWDDESLNIKWPKGDKKISDKDRYLPTLK